MWRFILVTFGFLALSFYELSGGADYKPSDGSLQHVIAENRAAKVQRNTVLAQAKPQPEAPRQPRVAEKANDGERAVILAAADTDTRAPSDIPPKPEVVALSQPVIDVDKADELTARAENIIQPREETKPRGDIREVTGSYVNLRNGPGTSYPRVGGLERGDVVTVLSDDGSGWVKLRVVESGRVAYIADFLLSEPREDAQIAAN